ncbi:RluA family pseudouridine synthase [Candidatus Symbiobacter mobilis]|uniref:Pseudouridine synthase n=1 Tax=Candidatus Symbiobacter mobilis CR TaxID=946483 RepID=U5NCL9_9BURK|nr:RluA family pseudouridine synthase [Candidatus Symbiobacter mobilis]AGX87894.1 ribosomal large subunit pseudouridine synthase C [Candidatus Symbiobacter mobilis CR]
MPLAASPTWLVVDEESAGQRLDNYLVRLLKGVPKTRIYRMIRSGEVRVNGKRAAVGDRLEVGAALRLPPVRVAQAESKPAMAPAREPPILWEDDVLLAIDKPSGLAVHGGSGVRFGVIEQLRAARPAQRFLELVHRLDRDTSGVLLVSKKRSVLTHLHEQFRNRQTAKTYLAMVRGPWPQTLRVLDSPLRTLPAGDNGERRVCIATTEDPYARESLTLVRVCAACAEYSLLEVQIKTGRMHQIRVHLAAQGHPILGDDKYGDFALNKALAAAYPGLRRCFLHAWRLRFLHPRSGERMSLVADLPEELQAFVAAAFPALPPLAAS